MRSTYLTNADRGSSFRIDDDCQYVYNLAASSLGVGTYRVDISINEIFVGHAVFALKWRSHHAGSENELDDEGGEGSVEPGVDARRSAW